MYKDTFETYMKNLTSWCGSMAEQLIRNEQVVGSIPTTSFRDLLKLFNHLKTQCIFWIIKSNGDRF